MKIAIEALSWLFKWHWFLGTYLEMELYFLTNGFSVKFFVINWITEYALTSVIEVLAHASDFEIKFADGILGKSVTQIKHFSSGSLSGTDISETEHGCHWTTILKYYFQNQHPGKIRPFTSIFLYLQAQVIFLHFYKSTWDHITAKLQIFWAT